MEYTTVKNLSWNREHNAIDCLVNFVALGEVNFHATPWDTVAYGVEIYNRCIAGEFGEITEYEKMSAEYPVEVIQNTTPTEGAQTL